MTNSTDDLPPCPLNDYELVALYVMFAYYFLVIVLCMKETLTET